MPTETPEPADRLDEATESLAAKHLDRYTPNDAVDHMWALLRDVTAILFPNLAVDLTDSEGPVIWDVTTPHRPEVVLRRNQATAGVFDGLVELLPTYEAPEVEPVAADATKPLPEVLRGGGVEVLWFGTDRERATGYVVVDAKVVGVKRTYLCRDGEVVGRADFTGRIYDVYLGNGLLGGRPIGSAPTLDEAQALIADRAQKEG